MAVLQPVDRAGLDDMVEAFIRDELGSEDPAALDYAVDAFEARASLLPEAQRLVVRRFAAALRLRWGRHRHH